MEAVPVLKRRFIMKVLDAKVSDKQDVRHLTDTQLGQLGIRVINMQDLTLQCVTCGETWTPELDFSGKLQYGYWVCPAKCNQ
jgi:hypothetical protein